MAIVRRGKSLCAKIAAVAVKNASDNIVNRAGTERERITTTPYSYLCPKTWRRQNGVTVVDATSAFIVADGWEKGQVIVRKFCDIGSCGRPATEPQKWRARRLGEYGRTHPCAEGTLE